MFSFPITHFNTFIIFWWMWLSVDRKPTDPNSAVMFFGWSEAISVCGSCTLAVLVGCGLSSVLFVYLQFLFFSPLIPPISLTVASLQGVAQDFMLSCNHCLTLSLFSVIFMSCWSLLQPPQLCSLLYLLLSLSWFCIAVVLRFFGVILLRSSSVCWLAFFLIVRHPLPSARRALSHGSVLRLFTVLWLVSGSQSCSCEAVSVSSMLWLVFRVDHVHKAPQFPGLTQTHPHIQIV